MKILVTKTSDYDYEKIIECDDLKACVDALMKKHKQDKLVISKIPGWYTSEAKKECDYEIEIYDDYRE